jgi:hypothetical protein
MAELADALDSGSSPRKGVEVRVLFSAYPQPFQTAFSHRNGSQKPPDFPYFPVDSRAFTFEIAQ